MATGHTRTAFRIAGMLATVLAVTAASAYGQWDVETVSIDTARMEAYLRVEAAKLSHEAWKRIDSRKKLVRERERLQREFLFMIGLDPMPERTPLQVTLVRTVERDDYTIEVIHYQSLPGFYVSANLYRPKEDKGPFPAVIWGPGHSADRYGAKALRQEFAIPWVKNGYICLVVDPIQVGEVFGVHRGMHSWGMRHWYARGYTPIGIEVWNAIRAVDYLLTRSDVDGGKLTINGVSGGGHLSWMAGAADERFRVVQPVAGTSDILTHVTADLQRKHCDCAYFINTYRHDWPTLAAIISPRPLLMHNTSEDAYYPAEGYLNVLKRAKTIFGWSGAAGKTGMFEVPGKHAYTPQQRIEAVRWSNRWLKGEASEPVDEPFEKTPHEDLAALGGMYAEHPPNINCRIQELLIPTAVQEEFSDPARWRQHRDETIARIRSVSLRNMPDRWTAREVDKGEHGAAVLESEEGIRVGVSSYVPLSLKPKHKAVLYVAGPGETVETGLWNFMKAYPFPGYAASRHMVYPRGTGREVWNSVLQRKYERNAMLLGRSLDGMRLYDVLCAVDYVAGLPSFDGTELTIVGRGQQGILGAYAALLDRRITRVILESPPASHKRGPVFLNVLRYTDIPEALAMLAPTELVFLTDDLENFDYTRRIYELNGAAKQFRRAYTVTQALNRPN